MAPRPDLSDALSRLAPAFSGSLLGSEHAGYDDARRVHNGSIDRRPALIARCRTTGDVSRAVALGRAHGLEIAVRGGGHNVAGRAAVDDGLMIDLSAMAEVSVDPAARTARAGGGATWGGFNEATQRHGLACTGGIVSSTGVAGLTLGGGIGWLMGRHGLAVDNLRAVELVTAAGEVVTASADEHPDLFWALRGGGGNFGVAAALEFDLHPVGPTITGGILAWTVDRARDVLHHYRELTAEVSDDLTVFAALTHAPDGSGLPLVGLALCHCGSLDEGRAVVDAMKAALGAPAADMAGPIPYTQVNAMLDPAYPRGAHNYWKSSFLSELSDHAIDTMVELFARCPSPMSDLLLEHVHGAATRVAPDATAFSFRSDGFNFLALGQWMDPAQAEPCRAWAREAYGAMAPARADARYVNYLGDDESGEQVAAAYGANFARLRRVKAQYDPENVFHLNQNIPPEAGGAEA